MRIVRTTDYDGTVRAEKIMVGEWMRLSEGSLVRRTDGHMRRINTECSVAIVFENGHESSLPAATMVTPINIVGHEEPRS